MKKLVMTLCLLGAAAGLSACESTGGSYSDSQATYSEERTAGSNNVRSAEGVFERRSAK